MYVHTVKQYQNIEYHVNGKILRFMVDFRQFQIIDLANTLRQNDVETLDSKRNAHIPVVRLPVSLFAWESIRWMHAHFAVADIEYEDLQVAWLLSSN